MKAVLVGGTSINYKIDKELIFDKTPAKALFYYKNGIQDYLNEKNSNKGKMFDKFFSINNNFNQNEKCEIFISFNINEKKAPPENWKEFENEENKFEKYFKENL